MTENTGLRGRIQQLEDLLSQVGVENSNAGSVSTSPADSMNRDQPHEEIISTFETLHMTTSSEPLNHRSLSNQGSPHIDVLYLLPCQESSERIIRHSLDLVGWVHCGVNVPRFLAEHDEFWASLPDNKAYKRLNHHWLAIYLSILSVCFLDFLL